VVGISLRTHVGLDDPAGVTVTLVLPLTPGILVTPPEGAPKYLDLPSIARLVLDFGDGLPASASPPSAPLP
jgi:hypothetical protein